MGVEKRKLLRTRFMAHDTSLGPSSLRWGRSSGRNRAASQMCPVCPRTDFIRVTGIKTMAHSEFLCPANPPPPRGSTQQPERLHEALAPPALLTSSADASFLTSLPIQFPEPGRVHLLANSLLWKHILK